MRTRYLLSIVAAAGLFGCSFGQQDDGAESNKAALLEKTGGTGERTPICEKCVPTPIGGGFGGKTPTGGGGKVGYGPKPDGYVTSPQCPADGLLVANAADVRGMVPGQRDWKPTTPIGEPIQTSKGVMFSLLAVRDTGTTRPTHVYGGKQTGHLASIFEINSVRANPDGKFITYLCSSGNDGVAKVDSGAQLSDGLLIVPDAATFVPPSANYYEDDIPGRQFWAGYWDESVGDYLAADEYGMGWYWVSAGTAGPFYNARNAYMADSMGNATDRYAVITNGWLSLVVYRPDAYKVTATTYAAEYGGIGSWAPPVPTTFANSFTNY